jgi:hypothetical protein
MLSPQAVERREIGNPFHTCSPGNPFLGQYASLEAQRFLALYHKKKNERQGKCRTKALFSPEALSKENQWPPLCR